MFNSIVLLNFQEKTINVITAEKVTKNFQSYIWKLNLVSTVFAG